MKIDLKKDAKLDFVAAGEVLIDLISVNNSLKGLEDADDFKKLFGGSPANVACNVARQNKKTGFISSVGNDGFGAFIISQLKESGVNVENIQIKKNIPTSIVCVTKSTGNPEFAAYRCADAELSDMVSDYEIISNSKIFHFSAFCLSKDPTRTSVLKFAEHAKKSGCIIGFEPNYRSIMWDENLPSLEYIKSAISMCTIIKPSEDDSFHIFGKMSNEDYCREYYKLGAMNVVLTLGPDGALFYDGKIFKSFPSVADEVIDTTGAGDAFWSGLYCGLLEGHDFEESIKIASYFSAFKLKKIGAVADIPAVKDILKLIRKSAN